MYRQVLIAAMLVLASGFGAAQELKLATLAPDGSGWMEQMRDAAERIHERTGGEVRVRFYPGGVMGDAGAVLRRMRLGQLHGGAFTLGDLASVAPAANLYSMPFTFRDRAEIDQLRAEFDPLILEALADNGIIAPAISMAGFAYLFSNRELPRTTDGISGNFRIWVPPGDRLSQRTLEAAGATPVPAPLADVYTSLQTGAINTFAATPSATIILQWHTRARNFLDMPLLMTAGTIGIDERALDRLDDRHRDIVLEVFREALRQIEADNRDDNRQAREALAGQGIERIEPQPEAVDDWHSLARDIRRKALERGDFTLPHHDRLERRLEALREEP